MGYKVVIVESAKDDLNNILHYLIYNKKNKQAAISVLEDFESTVDRLQDVAGSLKLCDNIRLRELGYHRMGFLSHKYFILYRIEDNTVFVDAIFHEMQDFENCMM